MKLVRCQTQTLLDDYVSDRQYDMRGRFGELLLLLPTLQTIGWLVVQQLHAANQYGLITVDSLLQEMLLGGTFIGSTRSASQSTMADFAPDPVPRVPIRSIANAA